MGCRKCPAASRTMRSYVLIVALLVLLATGNVQTVSTTSKVPIQDPALNVTPKSTPPRTDKPAERPTRQPAQGPTSSPTTSLMKRLMTQPTTSSTIPPSASPTSSLLSSPTELPTLSPTHASNTKAPTLSPTLSLTQASTLCTSSCPGGNVNVYWDEDSSHGECKHEADLQCKKCGAGSYKASGSSWTPCEPCGNMGSNCIEGAVIPAGAGKQCTVNSRALTNFEEALLASANSNGNGLVNKALRTINYRGQQVPVTYMPENEYPEELVRDLRVECGTLLAVEPVVEVTITKPASVIVQVALENPGGLPIRIGVVGKSIPNWVSLYDEDLGHALSNPEQFEKLIGRKSNGHFAFLVKSSQLTAGKHFSDLIKFTAEQEVPQAGRSRGQISKVNVLLRAHASEPTLSLLPSINKWTLKIGTVGRQVLALYNMQVQDIRWAASIETHAVGMGGSSNDLPAPGARKDDEARSWLTVSPESGTLEQGFECTRGGQIIESDGINNMEMVALINGTLLSPGFYGATINVHHSTDPSWFRVTSTVELEVLPGEAAPERTDFVWESSGFKREESKDEQDGKCETRSDSDSDDHNNNNTTVVARHEITLPLTKIQVKPRDSCGILTNQFIEQDDAFVVRWVRLVPSGNNSNTGGDAINGTTTVELAGRILSDTGSVFDSGEVIITRNEMDNSFIGDLHIRQKGEYVVGVTMRSTGTHIKGSPVRFGVLPRTCLNQANSQPHPETGYTCVCGEGYGENKGSGLCEPCPVGQFRSLDMLAETPFCRTCNLGTYQDESASKACKLCAAGHQPNPKQTGCTACQENHVVDTSSRGRNCITCGIQYTVVNFRCVCRPGFYSAETADYSSFEKKLGLSTESNNKVSACVSCPPGGFCGYGDVTTILPLAGYWRTSWNPLRFEKCEHSKSCLGVTKEAESLLRVPELWTAFVANPYNLSTLGAVGITGTVKKLNGCAPGFTGPLCQECAPGYYPLGTDGICFQCDPRGRTIGFFILSIFCGVEALAYLISRTIRARGAPRRREVMVLKIVLSHIQIIAMSKTFPLEWPPAVRKMMSLFDILSSAGSSALSTHCLFYSGVDQAYNSGTELDYPLTLSNGGINEAGEDIVQYDLSVWLFLARSLCYAFLPVFLTLFFVIMWKFVVPSYCDTTTDSLTAREKIIISAIVLLIVMQPFLTRVGFEFFSCSEDIDGRSFLEAQYTIQCWVGSHAQWIVFGALILTFYAAGIPLFTTFVLYCVVWKKSMKQRSSKTRAALAKHYFPNLRSYSINTSKSMPDDNKDDGLIKDYDHDEDDKVSNISSASSVTTTSLAKLNNDDRADVATTVNIITAANEHDVLKKWRPVYGFIYSGYREKCFFWEIVIMLRKAAYATVSVILRPIGVDVQTCAGLIVLTFAIVLHVHYRPYTKASRLHAIETTSLAICFFTLMGGLLIFSENTSHLFKQSCSMAIVLSNILFFLFVVLSIRHTLYKSMNNAFNCIVVLCGRVVWRHSKQRAATKAADAAATMSESTSNEKNDDISNNVNADKVINGTRAIVTSSVPSAYPRCNLIIDELEGDHDTNFDKNVECNDVIAKKHSNSQKWLGVWEVGKQLEMSFKLQRAAECYRTQGNHEAAAKIALEAADMAVAALKNSTSFDINKEGICEGSSSNNNSNTAITDGSNRPCLRTTVMASHQCSGNRLRSCLTASFSKQKPCSKSGSKDGQFGCRPSSFLFNSRTSAVVDSGDDNDDGNDQLDKGMLVEPASAGKDSSDLAGSEQMPNTPPQVRIQSCEPPFLDLNAV